MQASSQSARSQEGKVGGQHEMRLGRRRPYEELWEKRGMNVLNESPRMQSVWKQQSQHLLHTVLPKPGKVHEL
jgi:hypothetical protein